MKQLFTLAVLIALAGSAFAGPETPAPKKPAARPLTKGMQACREDIRRLCRDVAPGEGRLGHCLDDHLAELSAPCLKFARHGGEGHELESLLELDQYRPAK
jgi:hypothetical protein